MAKRKNGHVLHVVKSGAGWSAVSWCGTRFPRLCGAVQQDELERWISYPAEITCDRCRAALAKAKKI